jgi:hypothetical protein
VIDQYRPAPIGLDSVGKDIALHGTRDAIEDQVTDRIRREFDIAGSCKGRDLKPCIGRRFLVRHRRVAIILALIFVKVGRVKGRHTCQRKRLILVRVVRDLKLRAGTAHDEREATGGIDQVGKIAKAFQLLCVIVDRCAVIGGILNAQVALKITTGDVVIEPTLRPTHFKGRTRRIEAATIECDRAAIRVRAVFRMNIDHTGRAIAVLSRQRTRQYRHGIDKSRVEFLPETADPFGQENVIDAVLHVSMFAAQMKLTERILRHAGGAQQHVVERGVTAAGFREDLVAADLELRGAQAGYDRFTGAVEFAGDDETFEFDRRIGGWWRRESRLRRRIVREDFSAGKTCG